MAAVLPVINAAFTSIGTYLGVIAPVVAPVVVETGVAVAVLPYLPIILSGAAVLAGLSYLTSRVKDEHKQQEDEVKDRVKNLEKTNEEMRKTLEDTLKLTQQLLQNLLREEKNIDQSEYQDSEVQVGSAVTSQERPTPQEQITTQERPIAQKRSTTQEHSVTRERPVTQKQSAIQKQSATKERSVTQRRSNVATEEPPAVIIQERSAEAFLERSAVNCQIRELRVLIQLYEDYIARYANQPSRLLEETQKFQRNLCAQLKRVSSAMLDGFMSADALNIWVNGAAFHIQMLSLMTGAGDESLESLRVAVRIHRDTARILCSEYITYNQLTSNERAPIHALEIFFDDAYTHVKLDTQNLKVTSYAAIESVE